MIFQKVNQKNMNGVRGVKIYQASINRFTENKPNYTNYTNK